MTPRIDRFWNLLLPVLLLIWVLAMVSLWSLRDAYAASFDNTRDTIPAMSDEMKKQPWPSDLPWPTRAGGREVFRIAGDQTSGLTGDTEWRPHAIGQPKCIYSFGNGVEMLVEIDVYHVPGEPVSLHLLCPHCMAREHGERNSLRITADRKGLSYDPTAHVPAFPGWTDRDMLGLPGGSAGGLLSVGRFRCAWEVDPRHRESIGNVCDFEAVIDRNVIRRVTHAQHGPVPTR